MSKVSKQAITMVLVLLDWLSSLIVLLSYWFGFVFYNTQLETAVLKKKNLQ